MPFQWIFGFAPSPLRGEGWDEEWFKIVLNAANLTPAISLKRRMSKINPTSTLRLTFLTPAFKNCASRIFLLLSPTPYTVGTTSSALICGVE
ncbi:hypothetical protein, partial [Brenneria salicis]|uniref:hypothetical protein n=1 Tax=Brenneria salicis TaxID=55214 RepID=UPI00196A7384